MVTPGGGSDGGLRRTVRLVALLNLGYFGIELAVALAISSVALLADSIDFLEDAAVNLLVLVALGWSARRRAQVGVGLAVLMLVPGVMALAAAWRQFTHPVLPDATLLSIAGFGALVVNVACAWLLARYRTAEGSLSRAAFLSARNDAIGNVAIIAAGAITAVVASHWPDLVLGLALLALNFDAAVEVYRAARAERERLDAHAARH